MADWAYALSQGLAAGAKTGADIIDTNMKADAAATAEQRAANIRLDTQTRLLAAEDAMKNRAAERFSAVVKTKMGEAVPVEVDPISKSGLTRDSATAYDAATGTPGADFSMSPQQLQQTLATATATLNNPTATDKQREDARGLIAALSAQGESQIKNNAEAVSGKTRMRTLDEAQAAAKEYTLQNDAPAYIAGTGMLNSANKDDLADRRLSQQARIAQTEGDRRERMANAANEQKERIATNRDESRERAAEIRAEALAERAEKAGKGANKSAMIQNIEFMRDELKWTPEKIESFVFEKKGVSVKELAANILSSNKEALTPAEAIARARELDSAFEPNGKGAAAAGAAPILKYDPKTGKFK